MSSKIATSIAALTVAMLPFSASAADLGGGAKDSPSSILDLPVARSWQGPYIGVHAGYGWGSADHSETNGGMFGHADYDAEGAFGGVTAGYNFQFSNIVVGVEADLGYMDLNGDGRLPSSNKYAHQDLSLEGGVYGVAAGRLGLAFGSTLVYGKGGYAYLDAEATQTTTNPGYTTQGSDAFSGFVYGGGVEHKIAPNVSVKVEYLHFDFDKQGGSQTSVGDAPIGFVYKNQTDPDVDTVKFGVNYSF